MGRAYRLTDREIIVSSWDDDGDDDGDDRQYPLSECDPEFVEAVRNYLAADAAERQLSDELFRVGTITDASRPITLEQKKALSLALRRRTIARRLLEEADEINRVRGLIACESSEMAERIHSTPVREGGSCLLSLGVASPVMVRPVLACLIEFGWTEAGSQVEERDYGREVSILAHADGRRLVCHEVPVGPLRHRKWRADWWSVMRPAGDG